ncbi:hypothetical protein BU17DRAFT_80270 [Hysterangium stoloniferum]|nr:hypothetical protein BU17DRAFT_80270 [Hysterangium stoloniferum]
MATEKDLEELSHLYEQYFSTSKDDENPLLNYEQPIRFSFNDIESGDMGMEKEYNLDPNTLAFLESVNINAAARPTAPSIGIGVKYYSALALFKQAVVKITLMGTPLQTSPRDISALGQLIGLKTKKYDDNGESVRKAQIKAVRKMHRMFVGHILHHVPDSKDWEGKKLLDIPPHKDIIGILTLTECENEILKDCAEMARAKENITSVLSANEMGKLQTKKFYYEYQSAVSYVQEDTEVQLPEFQTLGDWEPVKSTNMDVCAKIYKHYLSDNNIPDVKFNEGIPIFPGLEVPSQIMNRRILIYSESPMVTHLLRNQVLELYRMKSLSIDGRDDFDLRDVTVNEFHKPDSPRIRNIIPTDETMRQKVNCTKKTWDACREQEESKSKPKWKSKSMTKVKSKLRDTIDTDFEDTNKVEGNRVQVEGGDLSMKGNEGVLDTDGPMMDSNGNSPEHFDTDMRRLHQKF